MLSCKRPGGAAAFGIPDEYDKNGNPDAPANANCWGTADYLAKDYEWKRMYEAWYPGGAPSAEYRFPYITLWGNSVSVSCPDYVYEDHDYYIDRDLHPDNGRAVCMGHGPNVSPEYILNAFDVVRIALPPEEHCVEGIFQLGVDDLGYNVHCVAYLCTDELGQTWVYEKHNSGNTYHHPYGINILGDDQYVSPVMYIGRHDDKYNSYFKKFWNYKDLWPSSYDLNWAGITE
jgi:hypothetical protein